MATRAVATLLLGALCLVVRPSGALGGPGVCQNVRFEPIPECDGWSNLQAAVLALNTGALAAQVALLKCQSSECSASFGSEMQRLTGLKFLIFTNVRVTGSLSSDLLNLPSLQLVTVVRSPQLAGPPPSLAGVGPNLGYVDVTGSAVCGAWPTDAPVSDTRYNNSGDGAPFTGQPQLLPAALQQPCTSAEPTKSPSFGPPPSTEPTKAPSFGPPPIPTPAPEPGSPTRSPTPGATSTLPPGVDPFYVCGDEVVEPATLGETPELLAALAQSALGALLALGAVVFIQANRERPIIVFSQRRFLVPFCIGVAVLNVGAATLALTLCFPSDALCNTAQGIALVAGSFVCAALGAKNWRAWRLHKGTHEMKRVTITDCQLWFAIALPTVAMLLFWVVSLVWFPLQPNACDHFQCHRHGEPIHLAMYAFLILLAFLVVVVAVLARNVPSIGAESSGILYTVAFFLFVIIINVALGAALGNTPNVSTWLMSFSMLTLTFVAIGFIVFRKAFYLSLTQQELYAIFLAPGSTGSRRLRKVASSSGAPSKPQDVPNATSSTPTSAMPDSVASSPGAPSKPHDVPNATPSTPTSAMSDSMA